MTNRDAQGRFAPKFDSAKFDERVTRLEKIVKLMHDMETRNYSTLDFVVGGRSAGKSYALADSNYADMKNSRDHWLNVSKDRFARIQKLEDQLERAKSENRAVKIQRLEEDSNALRSVLSRSREVHASALNNLESSADEIRELKKQLSHSRECHTSVLNKLEKARSDNKEIGEAFTRIYNENYELRRAAQSPPIRFGSTRTDGSVVSLVLSALTDVKSVARNSTLGAFQVEFEDGLSALEACRFLNTIDGVNATRHTFNRRKMVVEFK